MLVTAMVLGLVACGGGDKGSDSKTTTKDSNTKNESTDKTDKKEETNPDKTSETSIDTSEHVVITYMTTGNKPANTNTDEMLEQLNAILTEKVNAELQIYYIEWTDYLTNYNLTLAQMDGTVDLVGTATDWLDAWPNAKKGAFLELSDDMLKTYAP